MIVHSYQNNNKQNIFVFICFSFPGPKDASSAMPRAVEHAMSSLMKQLEHESVLAKSVVGTSGQSCYFILIDVTPLV